MVNTDSLPGSAELPALEVISSSSYGEVFAGKLLILIVSLLICIGIVLSLIHI